VVDGLDAADLRRVCLIGSEPAAEETTMKLTLTQKLAKRGVVLPEDKLSALVDAKKLHDAFNSERTFPDEECVEFGDED